MEPTCLVTNLFGCFTIHSNLMLLVLLLVAVPYGLRSGLEPRWLTAVRTLVTTYMVVTGVTFAVMVANAQMFSYLSAMPLPTIILHFVLPPYAVLDFLLAPGRRRLPWSLMWVSLSYPVLWGAYTLVRGPMVGWYPYTFLNPSAVGGYDVVAFYATALAVFILVAAFAAAAASRLPRAPAAGVS
ncbi:Pr6Pr family membrane protein [Kocuria sp. M1N1S27]